MNGIEMTNKVVMSFIISNIRIGISGNDGA